MPPGPAYNFLCVAHSVFRILSNVAEIRAAQIARNAGAQGTRCTRSERAEQASWNEAVEEERPETLKLRKQNTVLADDTRLSPIASQAGAQTIQTTGAARTDTSLSHDHSSNVASAPPSECVSEPRPSTSFAKKLEPDSGTAAPVDVSGQDDTSTSWVNNIFNT